MQGLMAKIMFLDTSFSWSLEALGLLPAPASNILHLFGPLFLTVYDTDVIYMFFMLPYNYKM